jgi:hypothetical protein
LPPDPVVGSTFFQDDDAPAISAGDDRLDSRLFRVDPSLRVTVVSVTTSCVPSPCTIVWVDVDMDTTSSSSSSEQFSIPQLFPRAGWFLPLLMYRMVGPLGDLVGVMGAIGIAVGFPRLVVPLLFAGLLLLLVVLLLVPGDIVVVVFWRRGDCTKVYPSFSNFSISSLPITCRTISYGFFPFTLLGSYENVNVPQSGIPSPL